MAKKVKLQVMVTDEIKDYVTKQSEAFGMSISSYVNMCIANYRKECESMSVMGQLLEKVNAIEKGVKK